MRINLNLKPVEYDFDDMVKLLHAIRHDPLIYNKVAQILQLDSYRRRFILNNWLKQLRNNNAPQNLLDTLSYLFDDKVSEQVLKLIDKS